jgi:hypothetical protein
MKYRMHKRIETKPDGRKIYYYTFEPVETKAMHAHLEASGHLPQHPKKFWNASRQNAPVGRRRCQSVQKRICLDSETITYPPVNT